MIKHIIYFTFFLWLSTPLMAQTTKERTNPQAGNEALQGMGNASIYNTDMYTGQANVSIPIYSNSVDGVDGSISLGYSTLGVKVDQIASWTGLGWNLNAAGYITRKVHDKEDDINVPALEHPNGVNQFYVDTEAQSGKWTDAGDSSTDLENDEFTAVFNNRTVNFMIVYPNPVTSEQSQSGTWGTPYTVVTSPSTNVFVNLLIDSTSALDYNGSEGHPDYTLPDSMGLNQFHNLTGFEIIDEQGNQYYFQRGDYEVRSYSGPYNESVTYYPTSKWNLTKVVTHNGANFSYIYNSVPVDYPEFVDQTVYEDSTPPGSSYANFHADGIHVKRDTVHYNGYFSYLKEIQYPNGVTADLSLLDYQRQDLWGNPILGKITITGKNIADSTSLSYIFNYAYFNSNSPAEVPITTSTYDPANLRLKLKSIQKVGSDDITTEPYYSFTYNEEHQLPSRLSPSQDYFGYYNGKVCPEPVVTNNDNKFPYGIVDTLLNLSVPFHQFVFDDNKEQASYGIDKTPDIDYAQTWDISSVTNGLGGKTEFYYTANVLGNPPVYDTTYLTPNSYYMGPPLFGEQPWQHDLGDPDIEQASDGVCLDHIVTRDGSNPQDSVLTQYVYSNGMRFFPYYYFWYVTNFRTGFWYYLERAWSNNFVAPLDDIDGAYHGYSNVLVKTYGYNNQLISVKGYQFTNVIAQPGEFTLYDSHHASRIVAYGADRPTHRVPREFMYKYQMGLICEEDEYDNTGLTSTDHLLSQTINTYKNTESHSDSLSNDWAVNHPDYAYAINSGFTSMYVPSYPMVQAVAQLVKSVHRNYSGGDFIESDHAYGYDPTYENVVVEDTFKDSKGQTFDKSHLYEFLPLEIDYGHLQLYHTIILNKGTELRNLSTGKLIKLAEVPQSGFHYESVGLPMWGAALKGNLLGIEQPDVQFIPLAYPTTSTTYSSADFDYVKEYGYDDQKNVIQTQYYQKNTYVSAIWDEHLRKKIAEVNNSNYDNIAYSSFEGGLTSSGSESDENLSYDSTLISLGDNNTPAVTGKYYYTLERSPFKAITGVNTLDTGKDYVISFWAKNGVPVVSYTATNNGLTGNVTAAMTAQDTAHGWTLYTGLITNCSSAVTIGTDPFYSIGGGSLAIDIDEVRLFPSDASMQSTTYDPIFGVTSKSDARDNITYYEYDPMGRLKATRDVHGNILSLTKTVVQGGDN